jgi:hypothetical protein
MFTLRFIIVLELNINKKLIRKECSVVPSKSLALKLGKEINHRLQKSKMNSLIKPYFTEGSVLYKKFDNGLEGVLLNENSINTVEMIKEIPDRFNN